MKLIAWTICYNYYECHCNLSVQLHATYICIIHFHPIHSDPGRPKIILNMTSLIRWNMLKQCVLWEVHLRGPLLWVAFYIIKCRWEHVQLYPCEFSWMWTLHSCFKKLVELLVMMTTDHSWLNGVSMNNNWLRSCKGPVQRVLPMTLSTTSRDEIWNYKYWTNIYVFPSTTNSGSDVLW